MSALLTAAVDLLVNIDVKKPLSSVGWQCHHEEEDQLLRGLPPSHLLVAVSAAPVAPLRATAALQYCPSDLAQFPLSLGFLLVLKPEHQTTLLQCFLSIP